MRKFIKDKQKASAELPSVEEMFVEAVRSSIELAEMLEMNSEQFVDTMKMAWQVDKERRDAEKTKEKT